MCKNVSIRYLIGVLQFSLIPFRLIFTVSFRVTVCLGLGVGLGMGLGSGLGEMGLGEMGQNHDNHLINPISCFLHGHHRGDQPFHAWVYIHLYSSEILILVPWRFVPSGWKLLTAYCLPKRRCRIRVIRHNCNDLMPIMCLCWVLRQAWCTHRRRRLQ